ncbi:MAG TPA: tetratricopeptide repeat protein [Terriglobales bacterium]|nr:tetratricopeptide repeat protein [Terriglobales bacterium]
MRYLLISISCAILIAFGTLALAQDDAPSQSQDKKSDNARATEESSSKDTRVDLSPPKNDQKNHPMSSIPTDQNAESSDVQELHPWDPHKAAKDVEVGDYYFKKKNYKAAISRYQEALVYKPNDAVAQFRLAESFDKTGHSGEAVQYYQQYLKILPHGPDAEDAQKALARLNAEQGKPASAAK